MSENPIICRITRDTYVRFAIVLAAFVGFGLYFFYDAAVGYRKANAAMVSYQAFANLGAAATKVDAAQWAEFMKDGSLLHTAEGRPDAVADADGRLFPLPPALEATLSFPAEVHDHAAMVRSWNDCWLVYSSRMHYPANPGDHPHDESSIREQWCGGGICMLVALVLLGFTIRTSRRELSLRGSTITAAGQSFDIADVESIDLRQWGVGFKGAAYFTVKRRRIKADGMTYGGFNKEQGEPAEVFMRAVLARYKGDIIDYEQEQPPAQS